MNPVSDNLVSENFEQFAVLLAPSVCIRSRLTMLQNYLYKIIFSKVDSTGIPVLKRSVNTMFIIYRIRNLFQSFWILEIFLFYIHVCSQGIGPPSQITGWILIQWNELGMLSLQYYFPVVSSYQHDGIHLTRKVGSYRIFYSLYSIINE